MIIIKLFGGLGNQMFQYAFGYSLKKRGEVEVKFDISFYENKIVHNQIMITDVFDLDLNLANKNDLTNLLGWRKYLLFNKLMKLINLKKKSYIKEDKNKNILDITNDFDNKFYDGYWQNWNYFNNYKKDLNKVFTFNKRIKGKYDFWAKSILENNSVCVHLRRGDYLSNKKNKKVFHELKLNYFREAFELIKKNNENLKYFIFSDDIKYAKKIFEGEKKFIYVDVNEGLESFRDMQLMSLGKHIIISNSTFSWWAAWLGYEEKKNIIVPKLWFKEKMQAHKYYLPGWHVV